MTLLASQTYEAGDAIVREGERCDAMYFIADGEVMVEADEGEVRLGQGDFFGEMALIERRDHAHAVTASTRCRVLLLQRDDFERLGRRFPDLMATVRDTARARAERGRVPH
jgi:CRP-like cAMP-binding protein